LYTGDRTCTVPRIATFGESTAFSSARYTGADSDHPPSLDTTLGTPARTREGFFEIIELGNLRNGPGPAQLAEEATHNLAGVPSNCNALIAAWAPPAGAWSVDGSAEIDLPTGGLYGAASVIDVADGTMFSYEATAIARFYTNAEQPGALHAHAPASDAPNLSSADNANRQALVDLPADDAGPAVVEAFVMQSPSPDPVTLALLRYTVVNDYNTDPALGAATEWVLSFPTKSFYTDVGTDAAVGAPFTNAFRDDGAACEEFDPRYFNREENVRGFGYGIFDLDPPPLDETPYLPPKLCRAVNVLAFNQATGGGVAESAILGTRLANNVQTVQANGEVFRHGHVLLTLDDPLTAIEDHRMTAPASARVYAGLPVLGFGVIRVVNALAQPGILASYGGAYRHRGAVRRLSP
jgi:hypothetical protein